MPLPLLPLLSLLTFLEVIAASDPTSADTYTFELQPPHRPSALPPLMDHSTHKLTQLRNSFFFSCICPPQPTASSDRKPQFPLLLLLLLWASHSLFLFLFIPLFSAFVFPLHALLPLSVCFSLPLLILLSPTVIPTWPKSSINCQIISSTHTISTR